jgi:hypothetical protein
MYLMGTNAAGIISAKISATGQAELAHDLIAQLLEMAGLGVERAYLRDHRENIDDRLGEEVWNGCTTDVVECNEKHAEGGADSLCFATERIRPPGIMLGEYDHRVREVSSSSSACGRITPRAKLRALSTECSGGHAAAIRALACFSVR